MALGLLGKKMGMTQVFDGNGDLVAVTLLKVGPCTVVRKREKGKEGYESLQLGFEEGKEKRLKKPLAGQFKKQGVGLQRHLREFRFDGTDGFQVGQTLTVAAFKEGDSVHVQGITTGRGFQGVIKKEGKHGGPDAHGSDFHRRPGSIGQRAWPGRVRKNMGMPGRMGGDKVTIRNLKVVGVLPQDNLLLVKGAVPGKKNGLLLVTGRAADFAGRFKSEVTLSESEGSEGKKD